MGDFKESTNTGSTGTAAKFGAADINLITALLNGTSNVATPDVNSNFKIRSGKLQIRNPGNTFSYFVSGSAIAADRTVTIPLLAGDDTLVTAAFIQTLTNKTLTAPVISTISNTGTITLPTATTTLVGRDTTDTLTNKTLTAPVISTVSNGGTITLPSGTTTLVGTDTTDTLTNKTLTAPIISTISNTGTLTLPTSTTSLIGHNTTESLSNKTLVAPILDGGSVTDATNISLGTSTGTKIGTATTQKIGFFNATPITQPAANADTSGATLPNLEIEVNQIKQLLRDLGLLAT